MIAQEEVPGGLLAHQLAPEQQSTGVRIGGAELHIVGDHEHRLALPNERSQHLGQGLFIAPVQPLGGLVQQENLRVQQQYLGQSHPLLLPSG